MNVETETYKEHEIEIKYDESPESPREWDNLCEIHYHSDSYTLGDTNWRNDIEGYEAMLKEAKRNRDIIIPMYVYIHSGVALSLSSFHGKLAQGHAEFDSGRAGTVIIRRKAILENWGGKIVTKKLREKAYRVAEGEIETFTQYASGEVYGYVIDEDEDSCWGFYSVKDALEEAKSVIDCVVKQAKEEHCLQLKLWIKNGVPLQYRTSMERALEI